MNQKNTTDSIVSFSWRKGLGAPEVVAIIHAVHFGCQSKEELLSALPMFHDTRLLSGLEKLISSDLISIASNQLVLHSETMFLDRLTVKPIKLPINKVGSKMNGDDARYLFHTLGIDNVAIASNTIKVGLG